MDQIQELISFLKHDNPQVRLIAAKNIASQTGNAEICIFLTNSSSAVESLSLLLIDQQPIASEAVKALINLSQSEVAADKIIASKAVELLMRCLMTKDFPLLELYLMLLSNLTRREAACVLLLNSDQPKLRGLYISLLVKLFVQDVEDPEVDPARWIGTILMNLSKLSPVREYLLTPEKKFVVQLLPYISHSSPLRSGGIIGMIRNCSFEKTHHEYLLSEEVDILPYILLPLLGPEEYDAEDMEGMPYECQFMEEDKERIADPEMRAMLVETLSLLCQLRQGRELLREKKVYPIVRTLDLWEKDEKVKEAIYSLVNTLLLEEAEEQPKQKPTAKIEEITDPEPAAASTPEAAEEADASKSQEEFANFVEVFN